MDPEQLKQVFDQQASSYDQKWSRVAAFRDGLHLLIGSVFKALPVGARVLCVGAGTGAEILYLAARFPAWTFTAVEPSSGMLDVCRHRAAEAGIAPRCTFRRIGATLPCCPNGTSKRSSRRPASSLRCGSIKRASSMLGPPCARHRSAMQEPTRSPPLRTPSLVLRHFGPEDAPLLLRLARYA